MTGTKVLVLATTALCRPATFPRSAYHKSKLRLCSCTSLHELRLYSFIHLTILPSLVLSCAGLPAILRCTFSRVLLCALTAISPGVKEWKKLLTCRDQLCVCRDVRMSSFTNLIHVRRTEDWLYEKRMLWICKMYSMEVSDIV